MYLYKKEEEEEEADKYKTKLKQISTKQVGIVHIAHNFYIHVCI